MQITILQTLKQPWYLIPAFQLQYCIGRKEIGRSLKA